MLSQYAALVVLLRASDQQNANAQATDCLSPGVLEAWSHDCSIVCVEPSRLVLTTDGQEPPAFVIAQRRWPVLPCYSFPIPSALATLTHTAHAHQAVSIDTAHHRVLEPFARGVCLKRAYCLLAVLRVKASTRQTAGAAASSLTSWKHSGPHTATAGLGRCKAAVANMGLSYNVYLNSAKIYGCKNCKTHLSNHDDIISRVSQHQ